MANTTFVDQSTIIIAAWLNDVNDAVYEILGDGTTIPTSKAQARTNLGLTIGTDIPSPTGVGASGTWPISISGTASGGAAAGPVTASGLTMTTARMLGRTTGGTGAIEEFTAAQVAAFTAAATTGAQGAVQLATSAEVATGTNSTKAITPAALRAGPIQSMVRLTTTNGYGSTNTMIRRFTTVVTNVGTDITYADSATLGASFTIVNTGVYAIQHVYAGNAGCNSGISLNSAQLTTAINVITPANCLAAAAAPSANIMTCAAWTGYLSAGDVIRAHGDAGAVGASIQTNFTITRVA